MDSTDYLLGVSGGMEEFDLGRVKDVAIVVYRVILGGKKVLGSVLYGDSFGGAGSVNLKGVSPVEGGTLGVS